MAGIEADEFNALIKLLKGTASEAATAAEDAAAQVYLAAAKAAAPRDTGQLERSISIIESENRKKLVFSAGAGNRGRLFVGPTKKKGFYGYFLEKGWKGGVKKIAARPWFEPAIRAADARAVSAAETAFESKMKELDRRG